MFTYTDEEFDNMQVIKMMTCNGCGKHPHELEEYEYEARNEHDGEEWGELPEDERNYLIDQWAWYNEGTMNWENGHYLCTECYIVAGMPSSPTGWTAP